MIRPRPLRCALACLTALLVVTGAGAANSAGSAASATHATEAGPTWASLTPAQQQALAPMQREWSSLGPWRKEKWLEVAARFPKMPLAERVRVQERMTEWARMTPAERTRARIQFQEVRRLPADERQAKWQAYQALPDAERKNLAQRAKPAAKTASGADGRHAASGAARRAAPPAATSHPVTPIVVQAMPGATTTTMSLHRAPAPSRVAGQPHIQATAKDVDPVTLMPRRRIAVPARPASTPSSKAPAAPDPTLATASAASPGHTAASTPASALR